MSAINGSTASSTSLKSVGNGAIKHSAPIKPSPDVTAGLFTKKGTNIDKAKTVDSKSGRNDKNSSPTVAKVNQEITPAVAVETNSRAQHEGKLGIANLGSKNNKKKDVRYV